MSKLTLEQIQGELAERKWRLISTSYQNLDTELTIECPEGHRVYTSLKKWRRNHKCPVCDTNPYNNNANKEVSLTKAFRILALDQATETTGWAIFDNKQLIKFGTITFNNSSAAARMASLKQWLNSMIANFNPDLVVLEDIQLQQKREGEDDDGSILGVTTYKVLAQLQGVLINFCFEKKIDYELVHVSTWRNHCAIKGRYRADKKKNAQLKIKDWYDVTVPVDAAEAICIGKYAAEFKQRINKMVSWEV
jgi:Holliday junction resolvasome RuvABC endonuclease subunit